MIRFDDVSPEVWASLCSPINEILPARPPPLSSSSSYSSPPRPTYSRRQSSTRNVDSTRSSRPKAHARRGTGALFIGSWCASVDQELLDSHKITQIVSIQDSSFCDSSPSPSPDLNAKKYQNGTRGVYRIQLLDSPSAELRPHLKGACEFIREMLGRGENVLVHCQQGISRSASVIIAYLIWDKHMSYDDALYAVKSKRTCIKPNAGFVRALKEWEKDVNA